MSWSPFKFFGGAKDTPPRRSKSVGRQMEFVITEEFVEDLLNYLNTGDYFAISSANRDTISEFCFQLKRLRFDEDRGKISELCYIVQNLKTILRNSHSEEQPSITNKIELNFRRSIKRDMKWEEFFELHRSSISNIIKEAKTQLNLMITFSSLDYISGAFLNFLLRSQLIENNEVRVGSPRCSEGKRLEGNPSSQIFGENIIEKFRKNDEADKKRQVEHYKMKEDQNHIRTQVALESERKALEIEKNQAEIEHQNQIRQSAMKNERNELTSTYNEEELKNLRKVDEQLRKEETKKQWDDVIIKIRQRIANFLILFNDISNTVMQNYNFYDENNSTCLNNGIAELIQMFQTFENQMYHMNDNTFKTIVLNYIRTAKEVCSQCRRVIGSNWIKGLPGWKEIQEEMKRLNVDLLPTLDQLLVEELSYSTA